MRKNKLLIDLLFPLTIFLLGLIALLIQFSELSYKTLIGFALSVLAVLISIKSYILSSISPYIIFAHRFHLTWIVSACLLFGYYDFDLSKVN